MFPLLVPSGFPASDSSTNTFNYWEKAYNDDLGFKENDGFSTDFNVITPIFGTSRPFAVCDAVWHFLFAFL